MAKVRVIPSTIDILTKAPITEVKKRRVAAYARVSTDSDEQLTSYIAQKDYYEKYIKGNDMWEFAGLYADEGISGTNTKKREQFNKMVRDAVDGKIDLIITKSVSRFARNTVDSLSTIRKLKEHGVECYFEKENIYTFDSKGELLITIMSSIAQEESRSISENVKWGKRKAMSDGKVVLAYTSFLGYKKGKNGGLEIVEEEAKIVRQIYKMYLDGDSAKSICDKLMDAGIKSPMGKEKWRPSTVLSILKNEKYKGDALLQKGYVEDFLTKKVKKNNGEMKQYYVENAHEPIIEPEEWDLVQSEIKRRADEKIMYSSKDTFFSKIKCGCCGSKYGKKVWHSNDKYRSVRYQCNGKFTNDCDSLTFSEEDISKAFIKAFNEFIKDSKVIIETCDVVIENLKDTTSIDKEIKDVKNKLEDINYQAEKLIYQNTKYAMDQEEYSNLYRKLNEDYVLYTNKYNELINAKNSNELKVSEVINFKNECFKNSHLIDDWDRTLFGAVVDEGIVKGDHITFKFKNDKEISVKIE